MYDILDIFLFLFYYAYKRSPEETKPAVFSTKLIMFNISIKELIMNIMSSAGVTAGIFIGIFIVLLLFKLVNTNHKSRTEYDERQKEIRGIGYMYGFYTIVIYECVMLVLSIGGLQLPVEDFVLHFGGIMLGCTVLGSYCIWHGAYWGLNNNPKRYAVIIVILALLNAIPVFGSIKSGSFFENGRAGVPLVNVLVLIMLLFFAAELLLKHLADRSSEEKEA